MDFPNTVLYLARSTWAVATIRAIIPIKGFSVLKKNSVRRRERKATSEVFERKKQTGLRANLIVRQPAP
jgi:hypothetical protein